jgi:hypothetical protein
VYYKRNAPYLRGRRRSRGPTEIVWPDKNVTTSIFSTHNRCRFKIILISPSHLIQISLGVPPERGLGGQDHDQRNDENLVVFSSPGEGEPKCTPLD